jgi:carboxyl-terminal processing protease
MKVTPLGFRTRVFFARFLLLSFTLSFMPVPVGAAKVTDVLKTADQAVVTRGDFLRAAVKMLNLTVEEGTKKRTEKIPTSFAPYVDTAEKLGALKAFGRTIAVEKGITRGEAVQVLAALMQKSPMKATVRMSDVDANSDLGKAVQVAIEEGWLTPLRVNTFGVKKPLTGKEARLLLQRATTGAIKVPTEGNAPIIRVYLKAKNSSLQKNKLDDVWDVLNRDYLYQDRMDSDAAMTKAIEGLVQSLNDPYTSYYKPAASKSFQDQLKGEVTGIGAQVEQKDGVLIIVAPLKGSPAERAGLQPGDQILSADGLALTGLGFEEAVSHVRGPKGSTVNLHIRRGPSEFDVSIVRDVVKVPEIEVIEQGSIAIVKLHQFGEITDTDLRGMLSKVQQHSPVGIILDLRNNPGGLLRAANTVVSNFLPKGSIVASINGRNEKYQEVTELEPTIDPRVKVVVIVNKGSASASEIVAGALQDSKRATIIGETTYGKGTVQQIVPFSDGSTLKMTIAEYLTPNEHKVDGVGITPDVSVDTKVVEGRDPAMERALDLAR